MASPVSSSSPAQPEDTPLKGRRVLLVDDDAVLIRAWSRTLSQHGMFVTTATRIQQAKDELAEFRSRPLHFALVDDRLPDGFGLDFVPALIDMRPQPSFAVVSAHPSTERALRAWQRQIVIVPKPVSPTGLLQLMGFLSSHGQRKRRERPRRELRLEALPFGVFVLGPEGLMTPERTIRLTATGIELMAQLIERGGGWLRTLDLCRSLYGREDAHAAMVVRRHVSLLRRALGSYRWLIESELQRGYRITPTAFQPQG
jgi:DNA-binding response OmpR family regulator